MVCVACVREKSKRESVRKYMSGERKSGKVRKVREN